MKQEKLLTLYTETVLDSCHQLRGYDGKCQNLHGHSWKVCVWIKGKKEERDEIGIIFDFSNIEKIKEKLDHKFINEVEPFDKINPTAENLSMFIYDELKHERSNLMFKVRIYETAVGKETYCEYGDF